MNSSGKYCRGPKYQSTHTALAGAISVSGYRNRTCAHGGIIDIPFPRPVRDALLDEGLAEEHHWVPNSGWITYRLRGENDFGHALWLMRLSYLRYVLKTAADPLALIERESEQLRLSPRLKTLLAAFLPNSAKRASAEAVPA